MSNQFLNRDDAPFQAKTWEAIDAAAIGSARSILSARKLLSIHGPLGYGVKAIPLADKQIDGPDGVKLSACGMLPLVAIQSSFVLSGWDLAANEASGAPIDINPAVTAAMACAQQEDTLIFYGSKAAGVDGLLTTKGIQSATLKSWERVGAAADDMIAAVTKLDAAGFHGPYSLALAPDRYHLLLRRNSNGDLTELDNLKSFITAGIAKAPSLKSGGVILAAGSQYAHIVLGQDLMVGFIGPQGRDYELSVSESVALRLLAPASVLMLK